MFENLFKKLMDIFSPESNEKNMRNLRDIHMHSFGSAIYDYGFLMSLDEKQYPQYLSKAFYIQMGKKLNLKKPKTLSEKIQWLKIYDNLPIKTELTDKLIVRDYVKEKISKEYLKPVFQVCNSFEEINYDKLPNNFVVKCNHGCKWHYIVKDKEAYLKQKVLLAYSKKLLDGYMWQSFFGWSDFELQYKNIKPKIFIEKLLCDLTDKKPFEIEVMCFNSKVVYFTVYDNKTNTTSVFDEDGYPLDVKFLFSNCDNSFDIKSDEKIMQAVELTKKLAKGFKLVRVDWLIHDDKLYFNELTFTPYSGYVRFENGYEDWDLKLGKMLDLKGN